MSKERLEEIDKRAKHRVLENSRGEVRYRFTEINTEDYEWLIEQAELVGYFARKNGELNEFLNKYIEPKHLGKNVIDVAMDIIAKQSERVQELEEEVDRLNGALHYQLSQENIRNEENRKLKYKNKRYREALEFYADEENYREQELKGIVPPRPVTFKPILHDYGSIARQALEGSK